MKNIITFIFLIAISISSFSQNVDIDILRNINVNRNKDLDPTFKLVTNSASPISIGVPSLIITIGLLKKDSSLTHKGLFIAETFVGAALISTILKYSIDRPRPYTTYNFIEKTSDSGSPSFPSGHTSAAFSTATSLSIAFPKWYVIAPSYLWAGSVGYSRLHLGVHYPSDVLAGAIIGSGSAYLCQYLNKKMFKSKNK